MSAHSTAPTINEAVSTEERTATHRRWYALFVLCLAELMIVLDTTIVNVALPSIRTDLGFSQTSLAWVINAYMLTFGGCLLLGGESVERRVLQKSTGLGRAIPRVVDPAHESIAYRGNRSLRLAGCLSWAG
jgi:MFS family permease